jgi:hypothetical protein
VIENGINAQIVIGLRASLKSDFVVSLWLKLERFDIKAESISINNHTATLIMSKVLNSLMVQYEALY